MQTSSTMRIALVLSISLSVVGLVLVQPAATRKAAAEGVTFKSPFGSQLATNVATFKTLYSFNGNNNGIVDGAFPRGA